MNDEKPTLEQLAIIDELIGELGPISLNWLFKSFDGWEANMDFWLQNRGRAEDLIGALEHMLNKEEQ